MTDDLIPLEEAQRRDTEAGSAPEVGPTTDAPPPADQADYGARPPESEANFDPVGEPPVSVTSKLLSISCWARQD